MELWYSLLSVLPFDWAQPGQMYFMKHALLAVLVITPLFGILSTMVVHSRMSFFSDALGHSAFTGMAIGAICGFQEPTWAAVIFAILFALLFNVVRRRSALGSDTVIGVFSSTAVALGIFLSTHDFATLDQYADKVILLDHKVLKMGPPDEVLSSPEFYQTFHLRMGKGGEHQ